MNIQEVIKALEDKGYVVSYFETKEEAADYLDSKIDGQLVGFGDSETLNSLNLFERLSAHNEVWDPQHRPEGMTFNEVGKKVLVTDIYFTSVNGMTETGELINIDSTGNRIGASFFGHNKVYFVVGTNKIVPTIEDAVWRTRNVAAPQNCARKGYNTPCATTGKCHDCKSPDRICRALTVHYMKMKHTDMEVVLINEALGL
ncbi:MAG: lactate utilization protein [Firmicutes bacterium]|nr:lactate utilization protein [Bacillota bacterium]